MWLTLKEKKTTSEDPPHTYRKLDKNLKSSSFRTILTTGPTDVKELFKAEVSSGKKRSFEKFHTCST